MISPSKHQRSSSRIFLFISIYLLFPGLLAADVDLQLTQISSQTAIVDIANAGDGSGRLFLVRKSGQVYIHKDGADLDDPFLDISSVVTSNGGEQGLLSLVFAPDYATSGYFYVWYTQPGNDTVLARYRVSNDPDVADAQSGHTILIVEQPRTNHNGGRLRFGPDGMLYLGLGDGGGSFDPDGNGQNASTLLGSLIRIDVNPAHDTYGIPQDNPFVGNDSARDEIWAIGLRNPWRISFDPVTGDLFIADVGQNSWEEVNVQPASSTGGENYGWSITEGNHCVGNGCDMMGLVAPVAEYSHADGCSVTGGEVYRGMAYPAMNGMYFYADYCTGNIWGMVPEGGGWVSSLLASTDYRIQTFGLGEDGSVYLSGRDGGIFLLSDGDVKPESGFHINAGLNDAWFDPATSGQGFLVVVFEEQGIVFVAWFTYDVERPPQDVTAMLGEPGHRWLTAQGPFMGDTAMLDILVSSGGVFDSAQPAVGPPVQDGTMTIKWNDCESGVISYDIPSVQKSGTIPIQRVVADGVALCEAL